MKVIDPGHYYRLLVLDGDQNNDGVWLRFVKREGKKFPGNVGHYPGTTMQEVLRAVIDRARYANRQIPCRETQKAIKLLTEVVFLFEKRAARRHKRRVDFTPEIAVIGSPCPKCGHIHCNQHETR